jgi:hypothetical protein
MNTQKQNIFIEKDIEASQVSNIYGEMNTETENAQKIETSFNKKLKGKKENLLLANTDTDTNMNTTTEVKTLTKGQIAYQKAKAKKEALKATAPQIVVEESDDEEDEPVADTIPAPEPVADEESDEEESDDDESDEEEEEEVVEEAVVEEDEEAVLLKRLAELKEAKAKQEARTNIEALRTELKVYQQGLIDKAKEELKRLTTQLAQIDAGVYDEELIAKHLSKSKPASKSAPKAKGEKGEKKAPTYEGKGKKAGTGDAREKIVANLNSGKTEKVKYAKKVGTNTWSLMYEERKDGGIAVVKDSKGVYSIPVLKEVGKVIGVSIKTKQDYIDWVKK